MRQQVKSLGKIWMDKYLSLPIPDPPDDDAPNVEAAANAVADEENKAIEQIIREAICDYDDAPERQLALEIVQQRIAARRNAR